MCLGLPWVGPSPNFFCWEGEGGFSTIWGVSNFLKIIWFIWLHVFEFSDDEVAKPDFSDEFSKSKFVPPCSMLEYWKVRYLVKPDFPMMKLQNLNFLMMKLQFLNFRMMNFQNLNFLVNIQTKLVPTVQYTLILKSSQLCKTRFFWWWSCKTWIFWWWSGSFWIFGWWSCITWIFW